MYNRITINKIGRAILLCVCQIGIQSVDSSCTKNPLSHQTGEPLERPAARLESEETPLDKLLAKVREVLENACTNGQLASIVNEVASQKRPPSNGSNI